jgi:predicted Rossmann fold flavoprotein
MCAVEAGRRERSVVVLEHGDRVGRKIAISGGGRCNFTNRNVTAEHYLSDNPAFCHSALAQFSSADFLERLECHGIRYHEKVDGQWFCDGSAKQVSRMMEVDCRKAGVQIVLDCRVEEVNRGDLFEIVTSCGEFRSGSLVVASGGLAAPSVGATDWGYRLARQFGIPVVTTEPALVPLVGDASHQEAFRGLSGISLMACVRCDRMMFHDKILFTHRGLSGPAILQASSYWKPGVSLTIDLMPEPSSREDFLARRSSGMQVDNLLGRYIPRRLAGKWCEIHRHSKPARRHSDKEWEGILAELRRWQPVMVGTEGYEQAEVTRGGIDTRELSSRTMEARSVRGLYFIGEVVDVTGQLGGYNLHWAWASGYAAGQAC